MSKLCIHGHFYQPPRFDPWLEEVLPEGSAAPFSNWNERITRESYLPLAFARRMDSQGNIFDIMNCYEHISFNFGPTILKWMEMHSPDTYTRILEGDARSAANLGRGNAMAQVYHHIIMPLSTDEDRDIEIQWSIADFEHRYKRRPEGMWLAETAACTETLEALARAGILFTILAPRQAQAVSSLKGGEWEEVDEQSLETDRPYLVRLPSGNQISVFFYDGALSQAVAFERLLADGGDFWQRLLTKQDRRLLSLATDGESYGHHFKFGEMALAYVLEQAMNADTPLQLTNYASYLAENPPADMVRIREKTSWSCIHGIERWRSDCGCKDGGHPEWNQMWRKPLRRALNLLKYYIDQHYRAMGPALFKDAKNALLDYGRCLCGAVDRDEFLTDHQQGQLTREEKIRAMKLLEMQRVGLAGFASCAWFFDEVSRIEPLNSLSYALRGMEMLLDLDGPDIQPQFLEILEEACSNIKDVGDGLKLWNDMVVPRKVGPGQMAVMSIGLEKIGQPVIFPGLSFELQNLEEDLHLEYEWNRTGETGQARFTLAQDTMKSLLMEILDSKGVPFSVLTVDKRLKKHILCRYDNKRENALWQDMLDKTAVVQRCMMEAFEEGQASPQAGLGVLSSGIVFQYLNSKDNCPDINNFWKEIFKYNPFFREIITGKITKTIDHLTAGPDPDWTRAAGMVERANEMGLYPDLFKPQNRLWLQGLTNAQEAVSKIFLLKPAD